MSEPDRVQTNATRNLTQPYAQKARFCQFLGWSITIYEVLKELKFSYRKGKKNCNILKIILVPVFVHKTEIAQFQVGFRFNFFSHWNGKWLRILERTHSYKTPYSGSGRTRLAV